MWYSTTLSQHEVESVCNIFILEQKYILHSQHCKNRALEHRIVISCYASYLVTYGNTLYVSPSSPQLEKLFPYISRLAIVVLLQHNHWRHHHRQCLFQGQILLGLLLQHLHGGGATSIGGASSKGSFL
jgi:hypothetical protein